MSVHDIAKLGKMLGQFLALFADCFARPAGRRLLAVYVQGLLSSVPRKNAEAMALDQNVPPRTLQRFLEGIQWDELKLLERCQRLIATQHAHPEAIGCVDETGITKSGKHTAGVQRQYNGNRGKIDNCVNHVALAYSAPGFHCLLDARLYLPKEWTDNRARRKTHGIPDDVVFQTKPQLALALIDRVMHHGISVLAWTADELYGRDGAFLDGLEARRQAFVVEIPSNFRVWLTKPKVHTKPRKRGRGRRGTYPRLHAIDRKGKQVRHLVTHSPYFTTLTPQRYRTKDTQRGSEVWEIRWRVCWRKTHTKHLISRQGTLLVARHVLTGEIKYFLSNRVPGRDGWSVRKLLRVAFGRWPIEDCFREAKEELGLDHFECRGWRGIHRHLYVTILSHLFCARVRLQLTPSEDVLSGELLTTEQVRRAVNIYLQSITMSRRRRQQFYQAEVNRQSYHARRNAQAALSHQKKRRTQLATLGIDPDTLKSAA
jgi:SRSO17 transposase